MLVGSCHKDSINALLHVCQQQQQQQQQQQVLGLVYVGP